MPQDLKTLCVESAQTIREALVVMDRSRLGIVLVVDSERHLVGTITDGDIRRALLAAVNFDEQVLFLLARKDGTRFAKPVTARIGEPREHYLALLQQHRIMHLPLVDAQGRVAGVLRRDDFLPEDAAPLRAVVMAGGQGSRLHPLTQDTPKPMLHVGDRPLLEIIIEQLRESGIRRVTVSTHHQADKIKDYFKDGQRFGVELAYLSEDQPLGTVGGLGLMEAPAETTLVINGDVLTDVDFQVMLRYHREHEADLTMAVRHYDVKVPFGVVECDGAFVRRVNEKPLVGFFVNAGIYLLEPSVFAGIPIGRRFDMTDLIQQLLDAQRPVASFPIRECWLDIGDLADYERAQQHARALLQPQQPAAS